MDLVFFNDQLESISFKLSNFCIEDKSFHLCAFVVLEQDVSKPLLRIRLKFILSSYIHSKETLHCLFPRMQCSNLSFCLM